MSDTFIDSIMKYEIIEKTKRFGKILNRHRIKIQMALRFHVLRIKRDEM